MPDDYAGRARTPERRAQFLGLGLLVVAFTGLGMINGLHLDAGRFVFPPCADSIGIPLIGLAVGLVVLTPILLIVGLAITRAFARLPVPLLAWDRRRPVRSWLVTIVFGLISISGLMLALTAVTSADFLTAPATVIAIYLLTATRAALVAPARTHG